MPIQKSGHSLLFIPNEEGKIFIVGGKDKKSFYYDLKKNYFLNWAETNFIHINPALINLGDYLYIIDTNKNNDNKIIFERTKLTDKKKYWEIIEPKYEENIINNLPNEFFGVSLDSKGNVIFIGGNNINMENNTTYVYNINENNIYLSNQGTNDNMIFKERTFYFYDNNYNVALPENLDEIKEIAFVDKNEQSLIKTNIDFVEKNIKYNFNNININNKNEQIKQKSRIIRNENIPKEYGYYMSSYSSAQAKLNAKKNKIDVIETNKTNKIVINIPINNKQKLDEQNEIKIKKENKEIKIEENYVDQKIEEQEQNNIEIIKDENINMNMNINNNIQYEEINTDNKPNEENNNQKYEKEIIDNINNEKNIEKEEINNNNNIEIENNLDIEHKEENYEEQENKIEGEENNEEIEEHFEQEEKEHEQENEYENEYENMNEQNENEHYEEHEEQQQQIINEQEDLQENEQIKIGEENNNEQEQEQEQNYEYEEQHEVEQEQKVEPIENVEEKEKEQEQEQEQHYEEHQEINEQEQEQENNEEQNYEENKDINIHEEEIQEHIQENNLENELNNLNQKSNAETLENPNEFENQQKTEEKHNEKENTEQNQQTQEKILDNLEETETPVEIDIEKLEKRLDNIMNQKLEEGNIKFNEVITKETIKESNNEISIQKNTDINIIKGDEKFHIEIKEQTTPLQNGSTEQKNEVLSSQEKSPNVFISGEENVEQDENEEMNEGENVEEEENGEYEEQERDTLLKTITENIGEDVIQIPDYLIAYYNEENFCDYEP